jgi:FeS assembly SUF system regulator
LLETGMIRLGKLTDYGLVLMTCMARQPGRTLYTARDLAAENQLPLPTVSKLLKQLLQAKLLVSHRGIKGGYSLARPPQEMSVAEVIGALEGPIALTECSTDITGLCDFEPRCPIRTNQQIISKVVSGALEKLTLSDLVRPLQLGALGTVKDGRSTLVTIGPISGRTQ